MSAAIEGKESPASRWGSPIGNADFEFAGLALDRPRIMGVINVTPDSFSDGGEALDPAAALERGRAMVEAGAAILDVGGESTRPGADPVPEDEEMARVLPVVRGLADLGAVVSIDTRRAAVMEAAAGAGARIINDVTALTYDPRSLEVAAASDAHLILMHMRGEPGTMQDDPHYEDAPKEVLDYLAGRVAACEAAGIERRRIAVDPGIGFGKTLAHNLEILRRLDLYRELGLPLVLGVSRKRLIAEMARGEPPKARLPGSIAAALAGASRGVHILRVHDVVETRQALEVWAAIGPCVTI